MTPQDVETMAGQAVAAGTVSKEQAAEWVRSDVAALNGEPVRAATGTPPADRDAAIRSRAAQAVASGEMSQEQADAALAQWLAVPPAEGGEGAQTSAPEKATGPLAASGEPNPFEGLEVPLGFEHPTDVAAYGFDLSHADPLSIRQLMDVGATFIAARMPAGVAREIYSEVARMAATPLDDKQMALLNAETWAALDRTWGSEAPAKVATARKFLQQLDRVRPGVLRLLEVSGAGSSPVVIQHIALHAERLAAAKRK